MTPLLLRVAVILGLLLATPVTAHQQKEAITRVVFNPRTGNIEVMHRFLLHDAEHASKQLFGQSADLLGNPADCDRFEDYVHSRFSLLDQDGRAIDLTPVGLWVYAEAPIPEERTAMTLSHAALRDVWPEQTNLVNVERNDTVRTATFRNGDRSIEIRF